MRLMKAQSARRSLVTMSDSVFAAPARSPRAIASRTAAGVGSIDWDISDVDLLHQGQYPRGCADVHAIAPRRMAPFACARVPDSKRVGIRRDPDATTLAGRQLHASPTRQPFRRLGGRGGKLDIQLRDFDSLAVAGVREV